MRDSGDFVNCHGQRDRENGGDPEGWQSHNRHDAVIESGGLLHARLKAALAGDDRELEFVSGHELDPASADQIPANMIGRLLDDGDLRKLHRMLFKKKPPATSVRRRTATMRRVGKWRPDATN
jgi:hypothetical protein